MVPVDSFVRELVQRLRFFRFLDPLPADGRLLARPSAKDTLLHQFRDYLHQVCHSLGLSTRIVPHQLRHTYATEMLRAGVSFAALMKLLGHTSPEMTMQYLEVALTDLQREFELARSKPRYRVPQPRVSSVPLRAGLGGVLDSLVAAQHALEMFRRTLPNGISRRRLDRLSNRLSKILSEAQPRDTMRMGSDWPVMSPIGRLTINGLLGNRSSLVARGLPTGSSGLLSILPVTRPHVLAPATSSRVRAVESRVCRRVYYEPPSNFARNSGSRLRLNPKRAPFLSKMSPYPPASGPSNLLDYLRETKRGLTHEQERVCDDFVIGVLSLHVRQQVWLGAVDMLLLSKRAAALWEEPVLFGRNR